MKKNLLTAVILMLVCVFSGLAIGGVNKLTEPIIKENQSIKEEKIYKKMFPTLNLEDSIIIEEGFSNTAILKKVIAKNGTLELGVIYLLSGKNAYGVITILVGIDNNGNLVSTEFLENGQSFAKTVQDHVNENYQSGLAGSDISSIDTECGATYGAQTVKDLVQAAFKDFEGGN